MENPSVMEIISEHLETGGTGFTVEQIVKEYLQENEFDGLFCPGECACSLKDGLFQCGNGDCRECQAGYRKEDPTGEFDFLVGYEKAEGK
jgi:hypothetical protein